MSQNRLLSQEEREEVLAHVKPIGTFKSPRQRVPFGVQATPWEERIGNLDEWREHEGMGKAILEVLKDHIKTQSVQNSISMRLRKLFPEESWTTYVDGKYIFLKFNGKKRSYSERKPSRVDEAIENGLFAQTG